MLIEASTVVSPVFATGDAPTFAGRAAPFRAPGARTADDAPALASSPSRAAAELDVAAGAVLDALDALVDRLPLGVAMTDRDGRLLYANAAARALDVAELRAVRCAVAHALLTGDEVRGERFEHHAPAGKWRRWLAVSVVPLRGADGHASSALITLVDETERIQATEWRPLIESLVRL
jgi:PAS domain-containing protein